MDQQVLKEMQDEELEAIQAIYMEDYVNDTQDGSPPQVILRLTPLQSLTLNEVHAKVDLHVKYTSNYPNDPPVLKLENTKGISNDQLLKLKEELDKMALSLCGEVMVLQLAQYVQSFLHQHNVPNLSFFEQMIVNQQKQEEILFKEQMKREEAKVAKDKEKEEDVIRQVKEELIKREEVLKKEKRKRQESGTFHSPSASSSSFHNIEVEVQRKPAFVCVLSKDHKITVHNFCSKNQDKKVFCSGCIGHFFDSACVFTAIEESSGKLMCMCDWKVPIQAEKKKVHFGETIEKVDVDHLVKQVQSIEQEFNYLKSKLSHPGIMNYHALSITHDQNNYSAKLLLDPITGPSLSNFLQDGGMPILFIQSIAKQLVDILSYLHSKSIAHRDLHLSNTFINSNNEVMISGYAVMRRISDVFRLLNVESPPLSNEYFYGYRKLVRCGKRGDIFNLGLILLCLSEGILQTRYPVDIPVTVPAHFKSFLECCLATVEEERSTIQQLSKHPFLHELVGKKLPGDGSQLKSGHLDTRKQDDGGEYFPFMSNHLVLAKSRLTNEFELLEWLGEGGFGSVIKVQNKLDGNLYAIKRIPLNPKSLHLNKRITREVKLLSRLNHENVVRYFNSWIEAEDIKLMDTSPTETDTDFHSKSPPKQKLPKKSTKNKRDNEESLLKLNNIPDLDVSNLNDSENLSWCDDANGKLESNFSSSVSSENDSGMINSKKRYQNSSYSRRCRGGSSEEIVFEIDSNSILQFGDMLDSDEDSEEEVLPTTSTNTTTTTTTNESKGEMLSLQYLYIQMEYCEKSTLRNAIDDNIYKKHDRVWRYFREIVEGLAHVHGQGIIHRDLKPFNIFMDSYDRIKIGDFGLATSHGTAKVNNTPSLIENESLESADDHMTGKVGTALYVAPELYSSKSRIKFSQKVDMYSLGVILFEMCYRPLQTGMERVKTLSLLRSEKTVFPEDFNLEKFTRVISWLLNHDPDLRPTAKQLLDSGYVPPKMEDNQLDELLKHTLNHTNSTRYQRLMSALFSQSVTPVNDQIYDIDLHGKNETYVMEAARILQHVQHVVSKIFLKHGAVYIETSLLIPKSKIFDKLKNVASFIDQSGLQVCLPYDSRISFARYVARNNINNLRRYYFGKLYRNPKLIGAHPIGLWECSFDIITDAYMSMLPMSELLYIVTEIIKEFPSLKNRNFYIQLNHTNLVKAICIQHNFNEETQNKIYEILETTGNRKQREEFLQSFFAGLRLAEHVVNKLVTFLNFEGSLVKAKDTLQMLRKCKTPVSNLVKQAFNDLERLLKHIENFGITIPVHVCASYIGNTNHYSGIVFQFVAENTRKRKRGGVDILAAGGCYNKLIESMSKYAESTTLPTSVGVSVAVDKILLAVIEDKEDLETLPRHLSQWSVIVCSVTNPTNLDALVQILHELWAAGISANLFSYEVNQDYTIEEIQEYCVEFGIYYLVVLKETDVEFVRVKSREKDKFTEFRIHRQELCDFLNQKLLSKQEINRDVEQSTIKNVSSVSPQNEPTLMFTFVTIDKIEANKKKVIMKMFVVKFQQQLQQMFGGNNVQIVAAKLEKSELKSIAAYLDLNGSDDDFETSLRDILEMYKEQGSFMKRVCNALHQVYSDSHSVVLLYSIIADVYRVVS